MKKLINKKYLNIVVTRIIMAVVIGVLLAPNAYALFYDDSETSRGNLFSATNLDLGLESDESNFEPNDGWVPGSSAERVFVVKNLGDLPFVYGLKYVIGNDDDLCGEIKLVVEYDGNEIYEGDLEDFDIMYFLGDALTGHMMLPVGTDEHEYLFKVMLPIDTDNDFADETCEFDIAAYAWMEELDPYTGFWDEDALSNSIETSDWEETECELGTVVFMIGDEESSQTDNPVDELNWPGEFGVFPDYDDPFVVGTSTDKEFPWNSNFVKGEATDFDIDFFYAGKNGLAKLTVSWSPGKSDTEQKEVFLDGDSVDTTPNRNGTAVSGWWEQMEIFQDEFTFPLKHGAHTLNMKHLKGDGTLWDYVKLEIIGCGAEEGDVIINELMWSGSTESSADEWIELYNDTDHTIDLDYWTITNAGDGQELILPVGSNIPAHSYFLISNFDSDDGSSALADLVDVDYVEPDIDLDDGGEELVLKDAFGNDIDTADGSSGWEAGENGSDKRSMERNDIPSTGWHSCEDPVCNDTTFWDSEGANYGTPKAANESENDPSEKILEELGEPVLDEVPDLSEEIAEEEIAEEKTQDEEEDVEQTDAIKEEEESEEESTDPEEEAGPEEEEAQPQEEAIVKKEVIEEETNE